jgi:LPXTG-motif cell wall-anchored protein
VVGRAVVATTAAFTVVATTITSLPITGLDEPWWAAPGAVLLVLSGALAIAYGRRRRRSTTT